MPLALPGFQIDADQAFSKQVVSWTMAAIVVRSGGFHGEIHQAQVFVHGDLIPNPSVAVHRPRFVLPGLVAEFTRRRNRIKLPELFAGPDIEGAHQTLRVVMRRYGGSLPHRGADDNHVLDHGRRRMKADFTSGEIDLLVNSLHHPNLEVYDTACTE